MDILDVFFEALAEIFFEIISDLFESLGAGLFPNRKPNGKWEKVIDGISVALTITMLLFFCAGLFLLFIGFFDKKSLLLTLGWIFFGISLGFILVCIIFKIVRKINKKGIQGKGEKS